MAIVLKNEKACVKKSNKIIESILTHYWWLNQNHGFSLSLSSLRSFCLLWLPWSLALIVPSVSPSLLSFFHLLHLGITQSQILEFHSTHPSFSFLCLRHFLCFFCQLITDLPLSHPFHEFFMSHPLHNLYPSHPLFKCLSSYPLLGFLLSHPLLELLSSHPILKFCLTHTILRFSVSPPPWVSTVSSPFLSYLYLNPAEFLLSHSFEFLLSHSFKFVLPHSRVFLLLLPSLRFFCLNPSDQFQLYRLAGDGTCLEHKI